MSTPWLVVVFALALAVALAVGLAVGGCAAAPLGPADQARVARLIADDRARYPELTGRRVEVSSLNDDAVFFQSNFTIDSALGDGPLVYVIQANPRALAADDDALRGVLAHELAHTLDYETRTRAQLVDLLGPALVPTSSTWERKTDLIAVDRGFGPGLLRFRTWAFRVLAHSNKDALQEKRAVYYGPLELSLLLDVKARCPSLFARFVEEPPATAHGIATRCP